MTIPSSVRRLEAPDRDLVEIAEEGKAPLHSTPLQMLLDYNNGVFTIFVFVVLRASRFLLRRRYAAQRLDPEVACARKWLFVARTRHSLHLPRFEGWSMLSDGVS